MSDISADTTMKFSRNTYDRQPVSNQMKGLHRLHARRRRRCSYSGLHKGRFGFSLELAFDCFPYLL